MFRSPVEQILRQTFVRHTGHMTKPPKPHGSNMLLNRVAPRLLQYTNICYMMIETNFQYPSQTRLVQGRLQTFLDDKTACVDHVKGHVTTW